MICPTPRPGRQIEQAGDREQSGRTWKFAEILAKATDVLGTQAEAGQWLERPAIGLDQHCPIDLLGTPAILRGLNSASIHDAAAVALGGPELIGWRLDQTIHASTWDSGEGEYRVGGRWNSRGVRAVYCSIDPATAILEVAVHKGFRSLDTVPHTLTAVIIGDVSEMQACGDDLLKKHRFVAMPSAVSSHSWNLVFVAGSAAGAYQLKFQEPFALDARLQSTELSPPNISRAAKTRDELVTVPSKSPLSASCSSTAPSPIDASDCRCRLYDAEGQCL